MLRDLSRDFELLNFTLEKVIVFIIQYVIYLHRQNMVVLAKGSSTSFLSMIDNNIALNKI